MLEFFVSFKIVGHGGRRVDMAWSLARWRHLVALHEATDAIHWAMRPALHRVSAWPLKLPAFNMYFLLPLISLLATTIN
jgi:hypothetical protein